MKKFILGACAILCALAIMAGLPVQAHECPLVATQQEIELPIIMYHLVTKTPKYIGKYGVTPAELERDMQYLRESGYTTVVLQDVINFVMHGVPLPLKPIMLTVDDGNYSDYEYLLPLLEKYDMRAVLAIMGGVIDRYTADAEKTPKAKYPNLTWPQVQALHLSGRCEIQSHGYDVHGKRGSGRNSGESLEAYTVRLKADLEKMQEACHAQLGYMPNSFIYPLGIVGDGSKDVLAELGMLATLGCEEGVNVLRVGDLDALYTMYRYNRPNSESVQQILARMR